MKTVIGLFNRVEDAESSIRHLDDAGFSPRNLTMLRSLPALWGHMGCRPATFMLKDFGVGVAYGMAVGGLFGVLAAVGQLTIGFGEATAIRTLVEYILIWGFFVGGILGLLYGAGEAEQETRQFIRGILRGGVIVAIPVDETNQTKVQEIVKQSGAEAVKLCDKETYHQKHIFTVHPIHDPLTLWTRRIARGLGGALLVLGMAFLIGEGLIGLDLALFKESGLMEGFMRLALGMALFGTVVAWVWEGVGGLLIIGSVLLFASINALASGTWHMNVLEPLFLLDGLLFLFNWWRTVGVELDHGATQNTQKPA